MSMMIFISRNQSYLFSLGINTYLGQSRDTQCQRQSRIEMREQTDFNDYLYSSFINIENIITIFYSYFT